MLPCSFLFLSDSCPSLQEVIPFAKTRDIKLTESLRGKRLIIDNYDDTSFKFSFSKAEKLEKAVHLMNEVKGNSGTFTSQRVDTPTPAKRTTTNESTSEEGKSGISIEDLPGSSYLSEDEWRKILPSKILIFSLFLLFHFLSCFFLFLSVERHELYQPGTVIIEQGSTDKLVTQVVLGNCDVVLKEGGNSKVIAQISCGSIFGEMAFMSNLPASASIVSKDEVLAYSIRQKQLEIIWKHHPDVVVKFYHYLCMVLAYRVSLE